MTIQFWSHKEKDQQNISKNYYLKVTLKLLYQQGETKQVSWFNQGVHYELTYNVNYAISMY